MRQRVDDRDGDRLRPTLLIADEPTTALDVTIQAQVLDLLARAPGRARHGDGPDHPRSRRRRRHRRPGRRDVRRPDRRGGPTSTSLLHAARTPTRSACSARCPRLDSEPGTRCADPRARRPTCCAARAARSRRAAPTSRPSAATGDRRSRRSSSRAPRPRWSIRADAERAGSARELGGEDGVTRSAAAARSRSTHLVKHFPIRSGLLLGGRSGVVQAVDGVCFDGRARARRSASSASPAAASRPLGRARAAPVDRPPGAIIFEAQDSRSLGGRSSAAARADADGLPGSVRVAEPAA